MSPPKADPADPFGTAALRASVLRAWHESPTRLAEDTNAERDLRLGAYRDRVLVELAQNAADAASVAGVPGTMRITLDAGELRIANTGAALDTAGVTGLASLRASPKQESAVGRFGVGFAAVLAVTDEPRIVSGDAGVVFSADRTRAALGDPAAEVPVLRLPWPAATDEPAVAAGFTTEVRLPLRDGADGSALLRDLAEQVPDVLLALPALDAVEVAHARWSRVSGDDGVVALHGPDGESRRWLTRADVTGDVRWAVPLDEHDLPCQLGTDVLHAPTPTDERLSLPARLIAFLPLEPSRRRVRPGTELSEVLRQAAACYVELLRAVPAAHRISLVPAPGIPRSAVDETLRTFVTEELRDGEWLPSTDGTQRAPAGAAVLTLDSADLVAVLADVVPGLVAAPVCGQGPASVLALLGAEALDAAGMVDALTGLRRPVPWWRDLYDVVFRLLDAREIEAGELGALPVPLADGRTVTGPRDTLIPDVATELLESLTEAGVVGLRLVHPGAVHSLLRRLGARDVGAAELLTEPAVLDAVRASLADVHAGADGTPLAGAVLRMVAATGGSGPAELGALAMPARHGWRRADELVLPGAELLEVLDEGALGDDGPLDVLDERFVAAHARETLAALGVLDGFAVVTDEDPAGPDHDLPGEVEWWDGLAHAPGRLIAVRDLDLVADDAWPAALRLLAAEPATWHALTEPCGYTSWWVARNALLAGAAPLDRRLPAADEPAGLYDPLPDVGLDERLARAAGVRERLTVLDAEDAADLLDRLGDPDRVVPPGVAARAHAALVGDDAPDPAAAEVRGVRTLDGGVADPATAVVPDAPWLVGVWSANRVVALAERSLAEPLAELLDVPLATEESTARVSSDGEYVSWPELPAVVAAASMLEIPLGVLDPSGVVCHERLTVTDDERTSAVPWWVDRRLHADDSTAGLARALAWAAGRWRERYLIAALLEEPDATVLFG